ncbi:MAG: glycosyltransferase family 2 protein [Patescibacteria group bacterium]
MPMTPDNPTVAVHIVAWNGLTHLPSCISAVQTQTYAPVSVLVVDNGSIDGTVPWLMSEHPQIHLLRNTRNLGFCRGHNQAIRITESPYVLCLNQDVVLTPAWIEQAVRVMAQRPEIGAIGGRLRRYEYSPEELKSVVPSGIIDSAGLRIFRSRHVSDRGSGQTDSGQFQQSEAVFGLSGACLLLRRQALESIRYRDEYFDENFFAYKDDVDLAWRMLRQGWVSWYDGQLIAYHHRSVRGQDSTANLRIARNYRQRQQLNAAYSYRNHWLLLMKNDTWSSIWRDLPWVAWYEIRKAAFLLMTRPITLAGFFYALRLRPAMRAKSVMINRRARRPATIIRTWWTKPA